MDASDAYTDLDFVYWVDELPFEAVGRECSMYREDLVKHPVKGLVLRTAIKSKCKEPVTYAVAMHKDDWSKNIESVYNEVPLFDCQVYSLMPDITECKVRLTPEQPITGWQLRAGAHGAKWINRVSL